MKESSLKTKKVVIRILTALSFLVFVAYQSLLLATTDESRIGRIIGIVIFLFITTASFLALAHNRVVKVLRIIFLTVGLAANFIIKLTNIPAVFGALDFSQIPSVLNCAIYICAQLGTLILIAYYLIIRRNSKIKNKRPATMILLSLVIALFVLAFLMECVLLFKYRVGIGVNVPLTLLSRIGYCFGFVGTAIGFMLPPSKAEEDEEMEKYINKEQTDAEDIVMSTQEKSHSGEHSGRIAAVDNDFMLTAPEKEKSHLGEHSGRIAAVDNDFMLTTPTAGKSHSDKKQRHMSHVDDDFMLTTPTASKSHSHKKQRHMSHVDDDFLLTTPTRSKSSHSDKKQRHVSHADDDFMLITSSNEQSHSGKNKNKNKKRSQALDDDVLVFSNTESSIDRQNKPK